jgi:hypothetical protein
MKQKIILSLITAIAFASCTENQMAKKFGGTMKVDLPINTEFVSATWKNDELWYIHRPRKQGETVDTITMQEDSKFGLLEGKVLFIEH